MSTLDTDSEKELEECRKALFSLKKKVEQGGEFIYLISHQLRTPMTGIRWLIEVFLKTEKTTPQGKKNLLRVYQSATRLSNYIELLLNVSRIEGRKVTLAPRTFDLVRFIQRYIVEIEPFYTEKNLTLTFSDHPDTYIVSTDSTAIHNIIQSLLINAIEYTPNDGQITVTLEKKDRLFLISIGDTGIGIPKEDHAHIFEKFSRGSNANAMKTDGTGLGLYAALETVRLLKGKIWFESPTIVETPTDAKALADKSKGKKERQGTTFYFELPCTMEVT